MQNQDTTYKPPRMPIWHLLNPRQHTPLILSAFIVSLALGMVGIAFWGWQTWQVTGGMLAVMFIAFIPKWREDTRVYGGLAMGIGVLLLAQGFHMFEHVAQWYQYYILNLRMSQSVGLLSPANAEWVHFTWNWAVLIIVGIMVGWGMRNGWSYALLLYAAAHTTDHTYLFFRYLEMSRKLKELCGENIPAQGLPGIIGQGGWLAQSELTRGTWISRIPVLTTAIRLDVHFYWNMGETILLLLATHYFLAEMFAAHARKQASTAQADA